MISFTNMLETGLDAYAMSEQSFSNSPNLRSHKPLPRFREDPHVSHTAAVPLKQDISFADDETLSQVSSERATPLASPGALNGTDSGLPPTPPSNSQDQESATNFSAPPYADGVVSSLMSKKPSLSTPVNQRSPPTPDPSPPRTTEPMAFLDRPSLFTHPSSRAESFKTAREDPFSSVDASRTSTPLGDKRSTPRETRGLGLAFESDSNDVTPTSKMNDPFSDVNGSESTLRNSKEPLDSEDVPNREWDTNLMRNVTIRRKRAPKSPQKDSHSEETKSTPTGPTHRRSSSLQDRIEVSKTTPQPTSIDNFAQSIGWPADDSVPSKEHTPTADTRRFSGSSVASTVVEAVVIVTPPQKRRTLRHSGKNLAYRRDGDSFTDDSSMSYSNRNSIDSDDVPLHRLVHKRAGIPDRRKRFSTDSDTLGTDSTASSLSIRKREINSAEYTLAHQESVRRVLQPAAEILSRSNSLSRSKGVGQSVHRRISSAPEASRRTEFVPKPRTFLEISPPESPKQLEAPRVERTSPTTVGAHSHLASPAVQSLHRRDTSKERSMDINKSLPELPAESTATLKPKAEQPIDSSESTQQPEPVTSSPEVMDTPCKEKLFAEMSAAEEVPAAKVLASETPIVEPQERPERRRRASSGDAAPTVQRGTLSLRGRSEERRRSSLSQDRTSTSRDTLELPRRSYEWASLHPDSHRRISFDRSTARTEEHAMLRHLYSQSTPFSQFSDTPIEVSEATAVSIYPHNNHSLLVVQQVARSSGQPLEDGHLINEAHLQTPHQHGTQPSPPSIDDKQGEETLPRQQPSLNVEPSTPPMQLNLPAPVSVDSPLKNPRKPPEPPVIKFIPPTPADELDKQLVPGPPKRSDSHPQRRLSLKERARRYSSDLISPFLGRASSTRARYVSDSHVHGHNAKDSVRVPTVNDEDGTLHPFWRPRGFWDGFEDSEPESDDEGALPQGGDTSEVEELRPNEELERQTRLGLGTLGRKLSKGVKVSGGFLIGNSLGVERSGTNRRRPQINLPRRAVSSPSARTHAPKVLIQPPTLPLGRSRSPRIEKRGSRASMRSSASYERPRRTSRREAWKHRRTVSGLGVQVQYIGLSGVKERWREKKAEKRRDEIRKSIGPRYYVEGGAGIA